MTTFVLTCFKHIEEAICFGYFSTNRIYLDIHMLVLNPCPFNVSWPERGAKHSLVLFLYCIKVWNSGIGTMFPPHNLNPFKRRVLRWCWWCSLLKHLWPNWTNVTFLTWGYVLFVTYRCGSGFSCWLNFAFSLLPQNDIYSTWAYVLDYVHYCRWYYTNMSV